MKKHIYILIFLILCCIGLRFIGGDFTEVFTLGLVILIYFAFILRKFAKSSRSKWLKVISVFYQIGLGIFLTIFIIFECIVFYKIIARKSPNEIKQENYAIVLGAGLDGENPGNILTTRLNTAIDYLNLHKDTKVIVSGGQGAGEIVPESVAMKNYLIKHGINADRILEDNRSTTTLENLEFSKEILEKQGAEDQKVVIVTSAFNLYRVEIVSKMLGIKEIGLGSKSPFRMDVNYSIREFGATVIDILRIIRERI